MSFHIKLVNLKGAIFAKIFLKNLPILPTIMSTAHLVKEMNKLYASHNMELEDIDEESVFSTITEHIGSKLGKSLRIGLEGKKDPC